MSQLQEINDPVPYMLAIDHVCEANRLNLGDRDDRQRAHFLLERVVRNEKVRCAWVDRLSERPLSMIRTFRGGVGWSDLARNDGDINDTVYDAADLEAAFPIVEEQAEAIIQPDNVQAENAATKMKNVRQPAKMWETFALELGFYLGKGGASDDGSVSAFIDDLVKRRVDLAADRTTIYRHRSSLMEYWRTHIQQ